jgi:uncharacterized protein (DUF2267 family)
MTIDTDSRPHSRACGIREHPHGAACHSNCPTCHGRRENAVVSKEGQVVGHVGNEEQDPFREMLAETADAAGDQAQASLPMELKEMAQDAPKQRPKKKSPSMQERFRQRVDDEMSLRIGIDRAELPFSGRDAEALLFRSLLDVGMYHERIRQERKDMIELLRKVAHSQHQADVLHFCVEEAQTMLDGMGIER